MNVRDVIRLQATVDALECPPWDPVRIRIEAILIKARIEAERIELEALRARARAN
jgi:hypothetical protein